MSTSDTIKPPLQVISQEQRSITDWKPISEARDHGKLMRLEFRRDTWWVVGILKLVGVLISLPRHMKTGTNRSDTRLLTSMLEGQIPGQLQMAGCHALKRELKQSSSPLFYLLLWSLQLAPRSAFKQYFRFCDIQGALQLNLSLLVLSAQIFKVLRNNPISTETETIPAPGSGACARRPRPVSRPSCLSIMSTDR